MWNIEHLFLFINAKKSLKYAIVSIGFDFSWIIKCTVVIWKRSILIFVLKRIRVQIINI